MIPLTKRDSFGIWLLLISALVFCPSALAGDILRGFNVTSHVRSADISYLKMLGVNAIRIGFYDDFIMKKNPPYEINEEALQRLDRISLLCEREKITLIVDPHTYPGIKSAYGTSKADSLWKNLEQQAAVVKMWEAISKRYKGKFDDVMMYDIINEPSPPLNSKEDRKKYRDFLLRIISSIRNVDENKYVMIESVVDYAEIGRTDIFDYVGTNKYIFSMHFYEPVTFTHQGVNGRKVGISYPGKFNGRYYDKNSMKRTLEAVRALEKKYKIPIVIGEFSTSRFSDKYALKYLKDVIEVFEGYKWSWIYHSFREADVWNPELLLPFEEKSKKKNSERMAVLESFFEKNLQ